MPKSKNKYYAVKNGRRTGIFKTWQECQKHTTGFSRAEFQSFTTISAAENYLRNSSPNTVPPLNAKIKAKNNNNIEFDYSELECVLPNEQPEIEFATPGLIVVDNEPAEVLHVYTDGSCVNNGKPNAKAGYGVYFGNRDPRNVSAHLIGPATNNRAELTALIAALEIIGTTPVVLYTDSQYCINGITSWIKGWKKNGWKTATGQPVINKDLWLKFDELYDPRLATVKYVKAHDESVGNEMADVLAKHGASLYTRHVKNFMDFSGANY